MHKKSFFCIALIAAQLFTLPVLSYADVTTVQESHGPAGAVYVAGNPDCYPIEYYDEKEECYRGVLPELLADISEESGVDFVYVGGGGKDRRASLAQNRQVELVSCCLGEKELSIITGAPVLSVTMGDETYKVSFGYTEIATEELKTLIESYIFSLSDSEMARRVATFAAEEGQIPVPLWVWLAMGGVCVLMVGIAVWAIIKMRRGEEKEEISNQTDVGTGAGNRQYLVQKFSEAVTANTRSLYYVIYIHFDIGRVNEYYGEEKAEELLRHTAEVLRQRTEPPSFFARVSGGGFAALRQYPSPEHAEAWTREILKELNGHGAKIGNEYILEFHAGIYKLQPDVSCEMALYAADQGCRYARQRKIPYVVCDERLLRSRRELEKLRHDVVQSIEGREFKCHLQFIVRTDTEKIYGAEVLSRWHHPEMGVLMPGKYIPDMEENGIITELDFYMLEESCRLLAQMEREGVEGFSLFCNFSRKTISLDNFFQRFKTIADRYRFDHSRFCIEITESSMFESEDTARESLTKCRKEGFRVVLDDVGSGYSSFSDLANYPVDVAKIDRDLLLAASKDSGRLLNGVNALFHSIHIETLCEGVETAEQRQLVQEVGIDLIQGFYIQRALPVEEAFRWMKEREGSWKRS